MCSWAAQPKLRVQKMQVKTLWSQIQQSCCPISGYADGRVSMRHCALPGIAGPWPSCREKSNLLPMSL